MRSIIALILFVGWGHSFAQEIYNPVQEDLFSDFAEGVSVETAPVWSAEFKEKYSTIRVKIFPHNSSYNSPQGKDINTDKFMVSSQGDCRVFKSEFPSSEKGITRDVLLHSGKTFEFSTDSVTQPIWVECAQPIELKRHDFPSNPIRYNGVLFIKKVNVSTPYLTAVNVLPFEQYLKGVVPSEMPASWSAEVLKAQAIAARTYAYYELGINVAGQDKNLLIEQSGAQIDDTVTYQAYLGLKNTTAATDKAVDETAGMVMTHDNKIIKAYFHADSGGYTENAENVWGVFHPYIVGKPEIYPEGSIPGTNWTYTAKIKYLEEKLLSAGVLATGEVLESLFIDMNDLYPSTRPKYVELKLANGGRKKITAVKYSFATSIKSHWITFSPAADPQNIVISGKGFGHGAGMNQWGARVMTDKMNKKFDEVLKFYYTDIQIAQ